jgi:hypothetical protein
MKNPLSIKSKVIGAVIGCLALGGLGLNALFQNTYDKSISLTTTAAIDNARNSYANLQEAEIGKMQVAAEILMTQPSLRGAFAHRDIDKLIELNVPIFERFKKSYNITILNYITPDEKRYLTMTTPYDIKLRGQKAIRFNVQECARIKDWVNGMALGKLGFALRATHPFYDSGQLKGGELLGYIELGAEIGGLLGTLKLQTHNEFGLLMLKKYFKEEDWAAQRKLLNLPNNWNSLKDILLANNTYGSESILAFAGDLTQIPDAGTPLGVVVEGKKHFARGVFPLRDASKSKVGAIFVLVDISDQYDTMCRTKWVTSVSILGAIVTLSLLLIGLLQRMVFQRLAAITKIATRLVGGDYETPLTIGSNDEIGTFENLFEQFRVVFVNVLKDFEKALEDQSKD